MPSGDEEYPPFREICMVFALGDHSLSCINHNKSFGDNVTENDLKFIMLHIAKSIEVTHSFGVAHRDLKLANILVQENRCQLTDFDLTRRLRSRNDSPPLTGKVCTLWYRPPECFLQTPSPTMRNKVHIRYDRKIDIWSLGCMMFELLTGKVLFPAKPKANEDGEEIAMRLIYSMIGTPASTGWATGLDLLRHRYARPELAPPARDTGFVPPVPYHGVAAYRRKQRDDLTLVAMPTEVRAHPVVQEMLDPKARRPIKSDDSLYLAVDLMMWMLDLDPDRRPTIQQVLGHPWLKSTQVKDAPSPERYEVDFPRLIGREAGPCLDIRRAREEALRRNQQSSISVQPRPLPATAGVVGQGRQAYLAPTRRGRGAGVGKRKLPDRGRGKRGRYN
ncbi:Protein kinase domain [Carpediemonas membranifera]|uniref:Protein kinase domain n=1 Tax=Carpediemonas membranifera TaxID=201153 RepID=A0A8J6E966_9EUKA|nr:Protein kinase domain [Carpediemonas membranifera]|eukprot:KAG9392875.1 Protein kinase domain [Carpediemonas membranifera]